MRQSFTMTNDIDSRYDHKAIEEAVYARWEKSGYFNPDKLEKAHSKWHIAHGKKNRAISHKPFAIIMPPPNANGSLHIGHAFEVALQDLMIRFWRMRGRRALWLPGADHAGFETQVVFDKKLEKEGRNRFEMPRDKLWREMWDFTQENKKVMECQLRKLGASCDWSREKFTLDPDSIKIVYETFEKLYSDGLAYRDLRVVNWCPKHKTALSDLEVKHVERTDPLYFIKYGPLTLATVRPETKFGDTALAVNPKDARYKKYVGTTIDAAGVLGPLKFKVIADDAVDPSFGTGVVKVTPAHDAVDFEIWRRHKDEISGPRVVIDENGRLTEHAGKFAGLKTAEAREKVAEEMKRIGILAKVDPTYVHQVATCYKCGSTLEPLPKPQWFVKMKPLAKKAIEVVKKGKIKFYPERYKKVYLHWLTNIRDWNISRQIVWGIRIPAWYCLGCREPNISLKIKSKWFIIRHGETDWNKERRLQGKLDVPLNNEGIDQAKRAAEKLKTKGVDLVITSHLARAKQTAEIIAKESGAELVIEEDFREKDFGEWEGLRHEEIKEKYSPDAFAQRLNPDFQIPGGEHWRAVGERIWRAFQKHHEAHRHRNVAIVSHVNALRALQTKIKNIPLEQSASYDNGGIWELELGEPCQKCGGRFYEQDPDVFDTWFSSGQWPFLALGFNRNQNSSNSRLKAESEKLRSDFETFYPTDVMAPAYEILFFWVARMVMLGLYRTGKIPFKTVYLHGLVRDKDRKKMSKSRGNVVDPLGVAELYGTDAARMALVAGTAPGNDPVISEDKIRGYRNFATKLWNIARFVLMHKPADQRGTDAELRGKFQRTSMLRPRKLGITTEDKKNLKELDAVKAAVTKHIEHFEFHLAAEKLYHYIWHTFADKIIESYKPRLQQAEQESSPPVNADNIAAYRTLETILAESLKMLHPFMPFITEELYGKFRRGALLMIEPW